MTLQIRHEGGGLLAFYRNGKRVREIGVTPGWRSNDRDEVIAVFNERATPPAGAGEAVEWQYRDDVDSPWRNCDRAWFDLCADEPHKRRALYAAPTPLPEAVRELPGKWRQEADMLERPNGYFDVQTKLLRDCADELDRALTGGDKQGDSSPTGDA